MLSGCSVVAYRSGVGLGRGSAFAESEGADQLVAVDQPCLVVVQDDGEQFAWEQDGVVASPVGGDLTPGQHRGAQQQRFVSPVLQVGEEMQEAVG